MRKNRCRKGTYLNTAKLPLNRQVWRRAPMVAKVEKLDEIDEKTLDQFIMASNWLAENFESVRKKFEGKFIALKGEDIIGSSESYPQLKETLEKKHIDSATVLIDFIPPKDLILFL